MSAKFSQLLELRETLNDRIRLTPYYFNLYQQRADVYKQLKFPDLAAMDFYKAILLLDECGDEDSEYHEQAVTGLQDFLKRESSPDFNTDVGCLKSEALVALAQCLLEIGCLRSAYDYLQRALRVGRPTTLADAVLEEIQDRVKDQLDEHGRIPRSVVSSLPDAGLVRRVVYPWNTHEEDRTSDRAIERLNEGLRLVAPKLEVRATYLPKLNPNQYSRINEQPASLSKQLGIFAKSDLEPKEEILREQSILTANNRLLDTLCDACSSPLPSSNIELTGSRHAEGTSGPQESLFTCSDCYEAVFCSLECYDSALGGYHQAVCGTDVETLLKDVPPKEMAEALYTRLLIRALAMSCAQDCHPLELDEIKYIWGDFANDMECGEEGSVLQSSGLLRTLPFTFSNNILAPLNTLEKMDISPYEAPNDMSECWVYNTLYAKFRGTASGKKNPKTGHPEVAAVHPLWCLANHHCDPNVGWTWAGEMKLRVRESKQPWRKKGSQGEDITKEPQPAGISEGEEILSHYVDIDLPVTQRREWGMGALGGACLCGRCVWEAGESA